MNAAYYTGFGGPEVLRFGEQPVPKVPPGWVLVRVMAAGVNPVDWKLMDGSLDAILDTVFPAVPGWDVAGVIERVGLDTPEFSPGDEVVGYARKEVVRGGTFAEYVALPAESLAPRPREGSWEAAAALPLAGMTALRALERAGAGAGEPRTVLVHAAAGGVGQFAVKAATAFGHRVIGTASPANHGFLAELGAEPVDYHGDWPARVRELAPEGVDAVVDFVGGVVRDSRALLREGGGLVSSVDPVVVKRGGTLSWLRADGALLARVVELVDSGAVALDEPAVYPLAGAAAALEASRAGHARGKLALRVAEGVTPDP
ncbi:alcohol dehydrogenase catalytic domain-containing protein [Sinomonas mesophila]|uniref:alcohol dehydrogenase catalytic domain-containing protein n=1 Tax=Sinomonas mesophila TaxID=1531955 RepID=UPI00111596F0